MKKLSIFVVIAISVIALTVGVYFGFKYRRGVPVKVEGAVRPVLKVPFMERELDLSSETAWGIWEGMPGQSVELLYQVMVLPWPKAWKRENIPTVDVKAFHNGREIFFYMEWEDETEDAEVDISRFSDAAAVMFPLESISQTASLMMGFLVKANIWQWKASLDREHWLKKTLDTKVYADFHYPFEEEELFVVSRDENNSAVSDLVALRPGTVTAKPLQKVSGRGFYERGRWKVVFKRSFSAADPESDARFDAGNGVMALAVWDGSKGDRGGRKSITDWVSLELEQTRY